MNTEQEPTIDSKREIYTQCYKRSRYRMGPGRFNKVFDAVKESGAKSVLDVGCGRGEVVEACLRDDAIEVIEGCEIVRELCGGLVTEMPKGIVDLPYGDNQFECVVCSDVLEHIDPEDTEKGLAELYRVASQTVVLTLAWFPSGFRAAGDVDLHCNKKNLDEWMRFIQPASPGWTHAIEDHSEVRQAFVVSICG